MKKLILVTVITIAFFSCKNEKTPTEQVEKENITTLKGEYVYFADAAVLQTKSQIFGVIIDEKCKELNQKAEAFKKEPTDFVQIEIKGIIMPKPEGTEGWENRVKITEIINVFPVAKKEEVVKLKSNTNTQ